MKPIGILAMAASLLSLAGCGDNSKGPVDALDTASSGASSSSVHATRIKISDVDFADADLARCVDQVMQLEGLTYTDELKTLGCNYGGKQFPQSMTGVLGWMRDLEPSVTSSAGLEVFTQLENLDLSGNWLSSIDLSAFRHLKTLNLSDTLLTEVDLSANTQLQELNLNATALSHLDVTGLTQLTQLSLDGSEEGMDFYLKNVLESKDEFANLELVAPGISLASYRQILSLEGLADMTALEVFTSKNHVLTNMDFRLMPALRQLTATAAGLTHVDLADLENLSSVDMSNNGLVTANFPLQLKKAHLANNKLTDGASFFDLPLLEELDLSHNQLETFAGQKPLSELTLLNLSSNMLDSLSLNRPLGLKSLDVSSNQLQTIELIAADNLQSLRADMAFAGAENLRSLSSLIGQLVDSSRLTNLELKSAPLSEFNSAQFTGLRNLTYLGLSGVALETINISDLEKLGSLEVAQMGLTSLDVTANKMLYLINATGNSLTTIDLSSQIQHSKECTSTCPYLYAMFFSGNPLPSDLVKELKKTFPLFTFN